MNNLLAVTRIDTIYEKNIDKGIQMADTLCIENYAPYFNLLNLSKCPENKIIICRYNHGVKPLMKINIKTFD